MALATPSAQYLPNRLDLLTYMQNQTRGFITLPAGQSNAMLNLGDARWAGKPVLLTPSTVPAATGGLLPLLFIATVSGSTLAIASCNAITGDALTVAGDVIFAYFIDAN